MDRVVSNARGLPREIFVTHFLFFWSVSRMSIFNSFSVHFYPLFQTPWQQAQSLQPVFFKIWNIWNVRDILKYNFSEARIVINFSVVFSTLLDSFSRLPIHYYLLFQIIRQLAYFVQSFNRLFKIWNMWKSHIFFVFLAKCFMIFLKLYFQLFLILFSVPLKLLLATFLDMTAQSFQSLSSTSGIWGIL